MEHAVTAFDHNVAHHDLLWLQLARRANGVDHFCKIAVVRQLFAGLGSNAAYIARRRLESLDHEAVWDGGAKLQQRVHEDKARVKLDGQVSQAWGGVARER